MGATVARPAGPASDRRLIDTQLAATVCLTALTAATVVSLSRVYADWGYLSDMLVVAIGTHVIAAALRYARVHIAIAVPTLLGAIIELISLVYYRDTLNGPFPGSRTAQLMGIDVRLVIEQFPTAVAPVPSVGNYAVVGAAGIALCALLADSFAFRAMGRLEAIVPTGVMFVFTAALGADNHRVSVAALWVGTALLTVAVLRFGSTSDEAAWMGARRMTLMAALPAIVATFGLTAVVAAAVAPRLPGAGERALIDTRNRQGSVTEVLSPIVDIGAQLRNRGNLEVFTVRSSDGPHYWRVYASAEYDDGQWSPTAETLVELGDRSDEPLLQGPVTDQSFTILGLGGNYVPAAYRAIAVSPEQLLWEENTQVVFLPDVTLQKNDRIDVRSMVPHPTVDLLRAATVDDAPQGSLDLPGGLPRVARDLALTATAGAATPYDKALALQNWFQHNFDYDVDVQYGNSRDAIEAFLRDRRGFCQQFAGTYAIMARSLGLPTRLALGYTPGELGADGVYHVYGRHGHTWPEVWFDGVGWVPFEPTPGRGSPDAIDYTGITPAQATGGSGGNGPTQTTPATVAPRGPGDPEASTTVPGGGRPGGSGSATTIALGGGAGRGGSSGGLGVPLTIAGLVAALLSWVVFVPKVLRALAHRDEHDERDRVIGAWQRTLGSLSLAGAPAVGGQTPLEYATTAELATGVDYRVLREMAVHVTRAVYSPRDIDEQIAGRCELLSEEIYSLCRDRTPTSMRLRAMVDPRLMRRRFAT